MKYIATLALLLSVLSIGLTTHGMEDLARIKGYTLKKDIKITENSPHAKIHHKASFTFFDTKMHKVCSIILVHKLTHEGTWIGDLNEISIEEKFQNQGLGTQAFKHIITYFKDRKCKKFGWSAYPLNFDSPSDKGFDEAQEKLIQWYERQGGIVDGSFRGAYTTMYYTISE